MSGQTVTREARLVEMDEDEHIYRTELGLGDEHPYWVSGPSFIAREGDVESFARGIALGQYPDGNWGNVLAVHVYRSGLWSPGERVCEVIR